MLRTLHGAIASSNTVTSISQIAWNLQYAGEAGSPQDEYSTNTQTTNPAGGIAFKDDGTKMYICDPNARSIYQYTLSPAWDITSATYDSKSLSTTGFNPDDIKFGDSGAKLYVPGDDAQEKVREYTLSTAWDISTATLGSPSEINVDAELAFGSGMAVKPDGTKFWLLDGGSLKLKQYTMSTAWDLISASYDGSGSDSAAMTSIFSGAVLYTFPVFSSDGTKFYVNYTTGDYLVQGSLSTAWDISTITDDSQDFSYTGSTVQGHGFAWKDDGLAFYLNSTNSPSASNGRVYGFAIT